MISGMNDILNEMLGQISDLRYETVMMRISSVYSGLRVDCYVLFRR